VSSVHRHVRVTDRSGRRDAAPADTNSEWGLPRNPARIDRGVAHHARDVQREGCAQAGYRLRDRPDGNRSARTDERGPHVTAGSVRRRYSQPQRDSKGRVDGPWPRSDGSDPDAWVAELASWVENNSVLVKRTFKGVSREFDVSLDALEGVLEPAYSGGDTTTSELVEDSVQSEAETFADARKLFAVDGERRRSGNSSPIPSICWRNSTPVRPLPHGCRRPRRVDPYRQRRQ